MIEEGGVHSVQVALHMQPHPARLQFKDVDIQAFFKFFEESKETHIIDFLRNYKLQDFIFLRGEFKLE